MCLPCCLRCPGLGLEAVLVGGDLHQIDNCRRVPCHLMALQDQQTERDTLLKV